MEAKAASMSLSFMGRGAPGSGSWAMFPLEEQVYGPVIPH